MLLKRILLASLLKPVNDTRLYEKIGLSLAKLPQVEVYMVGYNAPNPRNPATPENIFFYSLFSFKRLSLGRISAQKKYWDLLHKVSPDVIIIGTHELLLTSWLYSRGRKVSLVYDIQENYYLNLRTQKVYPSLLSKILASFSRGLETKLAPKIAHFFLAEACYAQELPFLDGNYSVLQNKFTSPYVNTSTSTDYPVYLHQKTPLKFLYSGTISELYGVLDAIRFVESIRQHVPQSQLTIIGYCADAAFLEKFKDQISHLPFVTLIGGNELVPHSLILEQEQVHHVGLLPYHLHPSTQNCVPTKLFEYQANGLVVLAQNNSLWDKILSRNTSGLTLDFTLPDCQEVAQTLLNTAFYPTGIPKDVFWREEEQQVQQVISKLLER